MNEIFKNASTAQIIRFKSMLKYGLQDWLLDIPAINHIKDFCVVNISVDWGHTFCWNSDGSFYIFVTGIQN